MPHKICLISANSVLSKMVQILLQKEQYEVLCVSSLKEFFDYGPHFSPQIIIFDQSLSDQIEFESFFQYLDLFQKEDNQSVLYLSSEESSTFSQYKKLSLPLSSSTFISQFQDVIN